MALVVTLVLPLSGCPVAPPEESLASLPDLTADLVVPAGFEFAMSESISLEFQVSALDGNPASQAQIQVFSDIPVSADPKELLFDGQTTEDGGFSESVVVPAGQRFVTVRAHVLGIAGLQVVPIRCRTCRGCCAEGSRRPRGRRWYDRGTALNECRNCTNQTERRN